MTALTLRFGAPRRRVLWLTLALVTIVGVLFVGVYPVRTYLSQRSGLQKAQHQLDVLQTENAKLEQQAADLNTDSRIETMARENYNLVRQGEEAYAILPAPPPKLTVPNVWPFTGLAQKVGATQPAGSP
jgi:cell division protein FtsL